MKATHTYDNAQPLGRSPVSDVLLTNLRSFILFNFLRSVRACLCVLQNVINICLNLPLMPALPLGHLSSANYRNKFRHISAITEPLAFGISTKSASTETMNAH